MTGGRPARTAGRRVLHALEAGAARLAFHGVRLLPPATASALGGWLGRTIGPLIPRSAVARRNLAAAFPDKSKTEIDAIVRRMWDNLGRTFLEFPHLDRIRVLAPDSPVEVVGIEHADAARDDGRPGIFFSAHLANWEVLGLLAAARGVSFVYRAPNNPDLGWLYDHRRSGDAELVPKGAEGAKQALRLLQKGGHLAMLVDQKMNDGIAVPFFGRDAMTAPALAQLAFRFECPVVPAHVERLDGFRFRVTIEPPVRFERSGERTADVHAAMAQINAIVERWIRDRPEQWLWLHRRWPPSPRSESEPSQRSEP